MKTINNQIEYAIRLADPESNHAFEDLFKLASLCEDIETMKNQGESAEPELEDRFKKRIKSFYENNGAFRSEVEHFPCAKQLIKNIV